MYRDNALALALTIVAKLEADGVTPSTAPKGYDVEAETLLQQLEDTPMEDLRRCR
jgi:uncharacterized protein YjeT (DUF2065 family)